MEQASKRADAVRDYRQSAALRTNLASVHFATFRYQDALETYEQARTEARAHHLTAEESVIDLNLASLYSQHGDLQTASRFASEASRIISRFDPYHVRHQLLAELAYLKARQGQLNEAISFLLAAIAEAAQMRPMPNVPASELPTNSANIMARDWTILGEELLLSNDLPQAEYALQQAYRIRKVYGDRDFRQSYYLLAWLRLEQGRLRAAAQLMKEAGAMPAGDFGLPRWLPPYIEGRILDREGDSRAALSKLRSSLAEARGYLQQTALSNTPSEYAQARLKQLYAHVIATSLKVDPLGLDGFFATEQDRTLSLYQSTAAKQAFLKKAPVEYWAKLAQLHSAEAKLLSQDTASARDEVAQLKTELETIENGSGLLLYSSSSELIENTPAPNPLRSIQANIANDEVLLSFHVARDTSALWAVTRDHIEVHHLRSEREIAPMIARFRTAVEAKSPDRDAAGIALYRELFGTLSPATLAKQLWIIAAEDSFFEIPIAALPTGWKDRRPVYLVEQHAVIQTPAAMLLERRPKPLEAGPFLGVGDGIYNLADKRQRRRPTLSLSLAMFHPRPTTLELPRLPASAVELDGCARAWDGAAAPLLLTGPNATTKSLQAQLARHPAVIHIASHFVNPHPPSPETLIHLGLSPDGAPDVLGEKEIASFRVPDALVVMSGCGSGNGRAVAMSGVLGLTRAWIVAGAQVVVGSRWPTTDDTGQLFVPFYRKLRSYAGSAAGMRAAAESLQTAQLEMIHSGTWRSDPSYWGAFYATGKD